MKWNLKHFFLLTASTLLMAFGTYFFKFTNNFTFGGITGLAVLVARTGLMSAGDFNLIASMLLLIAGLIILGKEFAARTAYCSILLSVALSVMERLWPMSEPLTSQPMLELCFAIALPALGSAVLFNIGSSSGGTDIIAMILKKYSSFDIGRALMISDAVITTASFFVFDIETGLYSFLGLAIIDIRIVTTSSRVSIFQNILTWYATTRSRSVILLFTLWEKRQRLSCERRLFRERQVSDSDRAEPGTGRKAEKFH